MSSDEFFRQLERGECSIRPDRTLSLYLHQIPHDENRAVGQICRLLDHAEDTVAVYMETIGNIMRWHGGDALKQKLGEFRPPKLELLKVLEELSRRQAESHDEGR